VLGQRHERKDKAIEKSAMRKIYLRLLPFAILSYFVAYIDRINVSFAGLTMRSDSRFEHDGPATFDEFSDLIEEVRFARDSLRWREKDSNPRSLSQRAAFFGSHHAEFVDDHPYSFQIGEHSRRLQGIT
jgi:hypothetical protein